jgi:hypothetical protein
VVARPRRVSLPIPHPCVPPWERGRARPGVTAKGCPNHPGKPAHGKNRPSPRSLPPERIDLGLWVRGNTFASAPLPRYQVPKWCGGLGLAALQATVCTLIVFLRLKCHCHGCKRYCRVDAHGLCPVCHQAEVIREEMATCLVGALAPAARVLLGLVMAFCTGVFRPQPVFVVASCKQADRECRSRGV